MQAQLEAMREVQEFLDQHGIKHLVIFMCCPPDSRRCILSCI